MDSLLLLPRLLQNIQLLQKIQGIIPMVFCSPWSSSYLKIKNILQTLMTKSCWLFINNYQFQTKTMKNLLKLTDLNAFYKSRYVDDHYSTEPYSEYPINHKKIDRDEPNVPLCPLGWLLYTKLIRKTKPWPPNRDEFLLTNIDSKLKQWHTILEFFPLCSLGWILSTKLIRQSKPWPPNRDDILLTNINSKLKQWQTLLELPVPNDVYKSING